MIAAAFLATAIAAGTPVVAVVDEIQRNAIEEWTTSKETPVVVWTMVKMTILNPRGDGKEFTAFCPGPPFVGRDHMWVGERITFRMPPKEWALPVPLDRLDVKPYILEGSIPLAAANRIFEEARVAAADDDGKLWGRSLYGPMLLVDPKTRDFIRNDLYTGRLPKEIVIANTAIIFE